MSYSYQIKYGSWPLDACNGTPATVYSDSASPTVGSRIYVDDTLTTPWTTAGGSGVYFVDTQFFGQYPVGVAIAEGPTYELGEIMLIYPNYCTGQIITGVTHDYIFTGMDHVPYRVEIWNQDSTQYSRIVGADAPFRVTFDIENKYTTIRGSACDLNILSEFSMQFIDLYTTDMFGCKIKLYNATTEDLLWIGYLNSELYTEPFNEKNNYVVSLTGNDGLALLERLEYLDEDGDRYAGISDNWTIVKNILTKLDIEWNNIYVGLKTEAVDWTVSAGESILSTTYSINENYYDEDGVAMTCREVLETILKPFSAYIQIINANVYITDITSIASADTLPFLKYNSAFNYVSTDNINLNLGDLITPKFAGPDQTLNIISPINKQKITWSPYIKSKLVDGFKNYIGQNNKFSGTPVVTNKGTAQFTWTETAYPYSYSYLSNINNAFVDMTGTGDNDGKTDSYIKHTNSWPIMAYYAFQFNEDVEPIVPYYSTDIRYRYWLRFDSKTYIVTTYNLGQSAIIVNASYVKYNLTIGDKSWNGTSWVAASPTVDFEVQYKERVWNDEKERYDWIRTHDKWVEAHATHNQDNTDAPRYIFIPLYGTQFNGSNFSLGIKAYRVTRESGAPDTSVDDRTDEVLELRIKDIALTITDNDREEIGQDDIDYISYLDKNVKDDGEDITLKLGTNFNYYPTAKGGMLWKTGDEYRWVRNFYRSGNYDYLENLLCYSIKSNYIERTIELQCTINRINELLGSLSYQSHFGPKRFGIQGAEIDYAEATILLKLQEIREDGAYTFIKNYTD